MEQGRMDARFGIAFTEKLQRMEAMLASLEKQAVDDPELQPTLELLQKNRELFLAEHDQAGASKFKRMGREMQGYFEETPDHPKIIEVDKDGKLAVTEGQENRRFMFVNMGELDRMNKEGGSHKAGDEALTATAQAIERVIRESLPPGKESKYTLLRYSGNEYAVSFDTISDADLKKVMEAVQKEKPAVAGLEPAPLVAEGFDLKELLETINDVQLELEPDERFDPADTRAASREIMTVMARRATYSLDAHKFRSRVERVQQVVQDKSPEDAKKFFDNYMAKLFKNTEFSTIDAVAGLSKQDARDMGFEFAAKMLGESRATEDAKRAVVSARVREIREQRRTTEVPVAETGLGGAKLAEIPEMTEGQKAMKEMQERYDEAEKKMKEGGEGDPIDLALVGLERDIEFARRDKGTGLLERGVHYESLEKAAKEGKEVSTAFIDMGFLKYFDNKGGPDVGDKALKMAASVIEKAIARADVKGTAFRYGGDEFTVQIDGGQDEMRKFQAALEAERASAGAIPAGKRGNRDGYYPAELVFNVGTADSTAAKEIFESLKAKGRYSEEELADPDRVANIQAEIQTLLADKGVEAEKAVDRFLLLVAKMREEGYRTPDSRPGDAPPSEREIQVDSMISFSNKAIFAEKGGGDFLARLAKSDKDVLSLRPEVIKWVQEKMQAAESGEGRKLELLDTLVEMHAKVEYYKRELSRLEAEAGAKDDEIAQLRAGKVQAEKDRDALVGARKKLEEL